MSSGSRKATKEEEPSFQIRPAFEHKFRPGAVKEVNKHMPEPGNIRGLTGLNTK